jgi:multiple sugar transport system permease protein
MVIFLAGLSQIDPELYEAATVDGANSWQQFWSITLPGLRASLLFVIVTHLIGSLQIFGLIFIMTGGGPHGSTRVMVQYIYENGFQYYKMGYASALAYMLMVIILIFTLIQFRILRPRS